MVELSMPENLRDTYLNGITEAEKAAKAYYVNGEDSPLTDEQYDMLVAQLERLGEAHGWTEHLKLSEQVAGGVAPTGDVTHRMRMLSLSKAQNSDELNKFINKMELHSASLVAEPKMDGLAIVASYKNGRLVQVATRGDSRTGQNVTARARQANIKGLPKTVNIAGEFEVRGEFVISRSDFETAQHYRQKQGRTLYKNPRNAVSGAIQSKDDTRLEGLTITFAVYDVIPFTEGTWGDEDSYTVRLNKASELGFITAASLLPKFTSTTVSEQVLEFGKIRDSFNYPTDGVVVKVDSIALRKKLGNSERHPYWAIAYKYEAEVKETTLKGVTRNVGRTGAISYVANLEPVELAETVVTKATLNNARFIEELDLRIGDRVLIRKANEIIPEILGVNFIAREGKNLTRYVAPTTCPKCGSDLDTTSSIVWRCLNFECARVNTIIHAVSRDNLDIEGLSSAIIDRLVSEGFIEDVTDLYRLSVKKLASLPMGRKKQDGTDVVLGEQVAKTLFTNIQNSKKQPLNRVLSSLGVRFMGRTFGRRFAKHFKTFDAVVNATVEEMQQVEGVKDKAEFIREGFDARAVLIQKYREVGFDAVNSAAPVTVSSTGSKSDALAGQSVVITGAVPGYSRNEAKELIEDNGGNAGSSVSSRTTLLVAPADERDTSKAKKALQLGIPIVTPEEFLKMLGK